MGRMAMPHKGPRTPFLTRLRPDIKDALHQAARARGMTANDLIAELIIQHTGLDEDNQEVLAFRETA